MKKLMMTAGAAVILAGCAAGSMFGPAPKDGEMAMPNYKNWPTYVTGIEKPDGHIRDIYINETGAKAQKGQAFANGTVSVMEIYKASKDGSGKMKKTELEKVFVMYKGKGWGASAPEGMKTGDWVYGAFSATGQPLKVDYNSCRGCHMPLSDKDFMFHYDKYFDTRASLDGPSYSELMKQHAGLVAMNAQDFGKVSEYIR